MTALFFVFWLGCFGTSEPDYVEYTVVSGDALSLIARDHGVTVAQIQEWNDLKGDGIDVGQVLRIYGDDVAVEAKPRAASGKRRRPHASGGSAEPTAEAPLPTPRAEKCIPPPTGEGLGDEGAVASAPLSMDQVRSGMNGILNYTLRCVSQSGRVETEIDVGCNGLVTRVVVLDPGPYDRETTDCIKQTLMHGDFDAHQLPDGMTFRYPLVFNF